MSSEATRAFMDRYLSAMAGPKTNEAIDLYISNPELKEHIRMFEAAFPAYQLVIDDSVVEGDNVAVRGSFRGRHLGEFAGIAPTGREVSCSLMVFYRIEADKVAGFWMTADTAALMEQLTAAPAGLSR